MAFVGLVSIPSKGQWSQNAQLTPSASSLTSHSNLKGSYQKQRNSRLPSCKLNFQQQEQFQSQSQSQSQSQTTSNHEISNFRTQALNKPAVIFVLGGPGSGKGTQCELLKEDFELRQLCVGELLRREASTGTPLGQSIAEIMQRGEIVPGHVTMSLLRRELDRISSTSAVLIDGFPRAMDQAIQFETEAVQCTFVLFFKCETEVMIDRLRTRATTSDRDDDVEHVFRSRLNTFQNTTMPVIEYYREKGLLREINAQSGGPDEVYQRTKPLFTDLFQRLSSSH